ncbi:MAG: nucleotidyltransferase family protein, partial [Chloroflexota bacterium]
VGPRPMIDYIYDQMAAMPAIRRVNVVTNGKFAAQFAAWAAGHAARAASSGRPVSQPVSVVNDHTTSDGDKLGAAGDMRLTIQQNAIDDDLLIVAGDNLFDFRLRDFVDFFHSHGTCVGLYDTGDLAIMSQYAVVELGPDQRIVSFQEKPREPRSTLAATAVYLWKREHLPLLERYAREGGNMDAPGYYTQWLTRQVAVYGFRLPGEWRDIGNLEQYQQAQRAYSGQA